MTGQGREIGLTGTISRLLISPFFIWWGFDSPMADLPFQWHQIGLGVIGIPLFVAILQLGIAQFRREPIQATGWMGTIGNIMFLFILFNIAFLHNAVFFYLGFSMLLAVIIGYAGCETLAISNWMIRRNDEVGCVLFSAFDYMDGKGCHAQQSPWDGSLLISLGVIGCALVPILAVLAKLAQIGGLTDTVVLIGVGIILLILIILIFRRFNSKVQKNQKGTSMNPTLPE